MAKFILIFILAISITLSGEDIKKTCSYNPTQKMTFEAGLHVGIPSGIDARFWFIDEVGLSSTLGFDYQGNIIADLGVLFQFINVYKSKKWNIMFDFGLSFSMGATENSKGNKVFMTGLYLPLELALPLKREPITFSIYFAPGTQIKPSAAWDYRWGLVFNYSFGKASKINMHRRCLSGRVGSLTGTVGELEGQNSALQGENQGLRSKIGSLESDNGKLQGSLENLKVEKRQLETNLTNIESEKEKLEGKYQNASSEDKKELQKQIEDLKRQKEEAIEAKNRLEKEKEELNNRRDNNNAELVKYNKQRCIASGGTFTNKCNCPVGRISRASECVCAGVNESWHNNKCSCKRGYSKKNGVCSKCKIVTYRGNCISKCPSPEVPWRGKCVCPSSKNFKRSYGKCVCKEGFKEYIEGKCDVVGN